MSLPLLEIGVTLSPAKAGLGYLSRTQGFARYARSTLGYTLPPALLAR